VSRLRILSRGAEYSEKNGQTLLASYQLAKYARAAARLGFHDDAISAEAKSIYLGSDNPVNINTAAMALIREGRFDVAERLLEKLATEHPDQAYFKNWLIALLNLESYQKGLIQTRHYNRSFPQDPDGHALTAIMRIGSRDPEVGQYLDSLNAVFPDHLEIKNLSEEISAVSPLP